MKDFSDIRGFNYQPSAGTTSLENWLYFDPELIRKELTQGKKLFPGFNTVRIWLSWDAYHRDAKAFRAHFETYLTIADELGLKVIVCLLNRWHDSQGYDNGGVYIDNFAFPDAWCYYRSYYEAYVSDIISLHRNDPRILIWDLVNEPYSYTTETDIVKPFIEIETKWLKSLYETAKKAGAVQPVGFSVPGDTPALLERVRPFSDLFLVHPYYRPAEAPSDDPAVRKAFDEEVAACRAYADRTGLPVIATETCWGALTDEDRTEIVRFTLDTLKRYDIPFTVHALYYSRVADLHYEEDGFVGGAGNLAFTNKDGSLRKGHGIFNEY